MKFKLKDIPISKGLFATKNIKRGDIIAMIKGKIKAAFYTNEKNNKSRTLIELDEKTVLAPNYPFTEINHSCDPNCYFKTGNNKKGIVKLKSSRKINKFEELRIDYAWEKEDAIPCVCGSKKCKGMIINKLDNSAIPKPDKEREGKIEKLKFKLAKIEVESKVQMDELREEIAELKDN